MATKTQQQGKTTKPKYDKAKWAEEAKRKANEIRDAFKEFTKTVDFQAIMNIIKTKGHKYSFHNTCLILMQAASRKREIEYVMKGYKQWQKEDEAYVLKGSKGYKIFAISKVKRKDAEGNVIINENTGKEEERVVFPLVTVFDISQTSKYDEFKEQRAEQDNLVYESEFDYSLARKISDRDDTVKKIVEEPKDNGAKGSYDPKTKIITLHLLSGATVLHEYGHHVTYKKIPDLEPLREYAINEIRAEIFNFLVHIHYNVDFNFTYSNIWQKRISESGISLTEFEAHYKDIAKLVDNLDLPEMEGN